MKYTARLKEGLTIEDDCLGYLISVADIVVPTYYGPLLNTWLELTPINPPKHEWIEDGNAAWRCQSIAYPECMWRIYCNCSGKFCFESSDPELVSDEDAMKEFGSIKKAKKWIARNDVVDV